MHLFISYSLTLKKHLIVKTNVCFFRISLIKFSTKYRKLAASTKYAFLSLWKNTNFLIHTPIIIVTSPRAGYFYKLHKSTYKALHIWRSRLNKLNVISARLIWKLTFFDFIRDLFKKRCILHYLYFFQYKKNFIGFFSCNTCILY